MKQILNSLILIAVLAAVAFTQSPSPALSHKTNGISYGLVVDDSGSLVRQLQKIRLTAKNIVANNDTDDETFILLFTDAKHIIRLQDLTRDKQTLNDAIDDIYIQSGDTAILDALYESAHYLAENSSTTDVSRRRALILLSDGEDRASKRKVKDVLTFLREKQIAVFVIGIAGQLEDDRGKKLTKKALNF